MQNRFTIQTWEQTMPKLLRSLSKESVLLNLVGGLSAQLGANPQLYLSLQAQELHAFFPHSRIECTAFFEEFGVSAAYVSQKYPLSVWGNGNGLEPCALTFSDFPEKQKLRMQQMSFSGKQFDTVSDICLVVKSSELQFLQEFYEILQHLDYRNDYLAMERNELSQILLEEYGEADPNTHFQFIPLSEEADSDTILDSLSIQQQKKLWLLFLRDGVTEVELGYLFAALEEGVPVIPVSWEISLRLAAEEAGFVMENDAQGLCLWDHASGSHIRAEEKLWQKRLPFFVPQKIHKPCDVI